MLIAAKNDRAFNFDCILFIWNKEIPGGGPINGGSDSFDGNFCPTLWPFI